MPYYYRIFKPAPGQHWRFTHSPLIRSVFMNSDNWQPAGKGERVDYSDDNGSPIKNRFETTCSITTKSFLANLVNKLPELYDFFPTTLLVDNSGKIKAINEAGRQMYRANQKGQYYFKPDNEYAGAGIRVFKSIRDFEIAVQSTPFFGKNSNEFYPSVFENVRSMTSHRVLRTYPSVFKSNQKVARTRNRIKLRDRSLAVPEMFGLVRTKPNISGVLQQGITDLVLYEGSRKFEYRIWILFTWNAGEIKCYYFDDAVMRLSTVAFDPESLAIAGNVTTSSHYYRDSGYKSDILSNQEYFASVWPQTIECCRAVANALLPYIKIGGPSGFDKRRASGQQGFDKRRASGQQGFDKRRASVQQGFDKRSESGPSGFEIMGFDFLLRQSDSFARGGPNGPWAERPPKDLKPVLIEINRNIGYYTWPRGVHAPQVVALNMEMIREVIRFVIERRPYTDESKFKKLN